MSKRECKVLFVNLFLVYSLISCHTNSKLEQALYIAGENRTELEKVLEHYEKDTDSLKLKAAIFLIENMPGHRSYIGDTIRNYYKELDLILNMDTIASYINRAIEDLAHDYSEVSFQEEEDLKIVTADYLIRNIDHAFNLWKNEDMLEHVTFDQFCEFILPYKCFEYQQLDNWRDTLSVRFNKALNPQIPYDLLNFSSYNTATLINNEISASFWGTKEAAIKKPKGMPFLNSSIYKAAYEDCFGSAILATMVLRSHGLPVAMDYIPQWGRKEGGHAWYTFLSDNGTFMPFSWGLTSNPGDVFFPYDPIPKIYRFSYVANDKIVRYLKEAVYTHPFFEIFEHDVTDEYMKTSNLSIQLLPRKLKDKYVYLSVFDNYSWTVLDLGIIKDNRAEFQKVGRDIVYLVWGYDGTSLIPISNPFSVNKNGDLQYFSADKSKLHEVCLYRKYPKGSGVANLESRIIGGEIHASNDKNFNQYELLYKINDFSYPDLIKLSPSQKYRYWRYYSSKNGFCNIAELQFYEENSDSIVGGKVIGSEKIYQNNPNMTREKAFDGDWLSIFHAAEPDSGWVGLDLERKTVVDRVRCVPRSDDNAIHYGEMYELFFWDQTGWKSLGAQKANDKVLYFDSVPDNVLLILRNHTRGKQERIFVYQNEQQVWW